LNKKLVALFLVVIAVIAGVVIYHYYSQVGPTAETPPSLYIDLVTLSGKSGTSSTINMSISNVGGEAKGVSLNLYSDAFGQVSSNSVDVPANRTVYSQCNAQIKDVANGEHRVTISCSYSGAGQVSTNNSSQFYVLPSIEITDVHFVMVGGFLGIGAYEDSTIHQNDNTTLIFEIKSNSAVSTYTDLSASATSPQGTLGLVITLSPPTLDNIGPQGTSREYSFAISTHNTPLGKYIITIHIFSGQYEVARDSSRTLTVS